MEHDRGWSSPSSFFLDRCSWEGSPDASPSAGPNGGPQVGRSERKMSGHQPSVSLNPGLWGDDLCPPGTFALFLSHWFSTGGNLPTPPQRHQQPPETSLVASPRTVLLPSTRQTSVLVAQLCPTLGHPMHTNGGVTLWGATPGQPLPTPLLSCPDGRRQPVPSRRAALHSRNSGRVSGAQGTAGAFLWWPLMLASGETSCKLSPEESDPRVLTCNWNLGPRHTLALSWINSP